jgi:hypothetical protein
VVICTRTQDLPRLTLCGEALLAKELHRDGDEFVAEFERLIDAWAGRTVLVLDAGGISERLQLDIGPHQKKLGPGAWEALIEELSQISTGLPWGFSPGGAEGTMTPDALSTVHPAIVENQLPIFLRLMLQFVGDPPMSTLRTRAFRPLDVTRAADLRTIRSLARRPLELAGVRGLAPEALTPNVRVLVDQPNATTTFDHPVTRYVVFLLQKVRARLLSTAHNLRSAAGHGIPNAVATNYARQLADDVDRARHVLEDLQKTRLFRGVKSEPISNTAIQALPDHPLYLAIHRVGRRLANPGLAYGPGHDVISALKHSYDLFEIAVLYRLVAALGVALGAEWQAAGSGQVARYPREDRPPDGSSWTWNGPGGQSLELVYQRVFKAATLTSDPYGPQSITAQCVPDYVLIYRRGSKPVSWMILDAKYRSGRQSVHDALGDLHRYRDALRLSQSHASAAYIIVPALQEDAALYASPSYLEMHRFGAICIYQTDWFIPIRTWLEVMQTIRASTGDEEGS